MDYLKRSEELFEASVRARRDLHQIPEVGLDLPKTTAYVQTRLEELGYEVQRCGGGLVATVGKPGGKTILLRADMDALPMREESGLPFASTCDNAHTCGHDFHTTMLLTAAQMLKENEDALQGVVKLMFQPAEETFMGAKSMIQAGVLEDPKPDVALAYHVTSGNGPLGLFAYRREGTMMNSSDNFKIFIQGKGSHGAYPDSGVDPITISAYIILALESVVAREIKSTQASVLTIGKVVAGTAGNIIPDTAELHGTLRCDSSEEREFILKRIQEVAQGVAQTHRGTAEVSIVAGTAPLVNNPEAIDAFVGYMHELPVENQAEYSDTHAMPSEDWAEVLRLVPGAYMFLSAGFTDGRTTYNQHHPKVVFNEEVLKVGPAYLAHCATRWLEEHGSEV